MATTRNRRSAAGWIGFAAIAGCLFPSSALAVPPEIHPPTGKSRHATVILIHGGSWSATGEAMMATVRPSARRFQRYGYRTLSTDYSRGIDGFADIRAVAQAQARSRPEEPVCAYGESAGGHWALLLAAAEPSIDCVIAVAAPTDLTAGLGDGLDTVAGLVFGELAGDYSPIRYASRIGADVLLPYGSDDTLVPAAQGAHMASALRSRKLTVLPAGGRKWIHGTASGSAIRRLHQLERRWLARSL